MITEILNNHPCNTISQPKLKKSCDEQQRYPTYWLRESYEFEDFNIGGVNIPLDDVEFCR